MTTTTTTAQPPARFAQASFRRYEPLLFSVVTNHPAAITYKTKTPNATACAFRNAMRSLYQYQWKTNIPHNLFLKLYEAKAIVVREGDGCIVIGDKNTTKPTKELAPDMSGCIIQPNNEGVLHSFVGSYAYILCVLAEKRLLTQPVLITNLSDDNAKELSQSHDVLLEKSSDNQWRLT